jgi:hypothetical protein
MKKIMLFLFLLLFVTGCSIVRIDTSSIDNILNIILTNDNKLFNQVGQGYKYYLPNGVTYIDSDEANDTLYCNGNYYYLYIDAINYFYQNRIEYKEDDSTYYSKAITTKDGFSHSGYLDIEEKDGFYYIEFVYNYAKIEAIVNEKELNDTILNASYILSTIKYNYNIIKLSLEDDYFTNKTTKYDKYELKEDSGNFIIEKENIIKEG